MQTVKVKESPILFSGAMIRAILEGRKTQTRRIVKTPKKTVDFYLNGAGKWTKSKTGEWHEIAYDAEITDGLAYFLVAGDMGWDGGIPCPYGSAGSKLWVRETWGESPFYNKYFYKADYQSGIVEGGWKPSIFMPRSASRITLEITGLRVERLQDISEEDAIAEGARRFDNLPSIHPYGQDPRWSMEEAPPSTDYCLNSARLAFANYWNKLNEKRGYSWDSNPFVWVVGFKRIEG